MPLERIEHENGVVFYRSPLLCAAGIRHGFTTRIGGTSKGAYATLNLATLEKSPDTDFNLSVAENFRRLRQAVGCDRLPRVEVNQAHGAEVWRVPAKAVRPADAAYADAMICDYPNKLLTIRTADCVPVLLASGDGRAIAAVHAGWRGIVAGVIPATIARLGEVFGVRADAVIAAVGPCISAEYFEVGPEVAQAFEACGLPETVRKSDGDVKPHIDLKAAALRQLIDAKVARKNVDVSDHCTYRDADEFFSYRRDGGVTGRMAAVIAL